MNHDRRAMGVLHRHRRNPGVERGHIGGEENEMTRDEIISMPAGREMDALVAEKVMGEKMPIYVHMKEHIMYDEKSTAGNWYCSQLYEHGDVCEWHPRPFSTDIAAAWEVISEMEAKGFWFYLGILSSYCSVTFIRRDWDIFGADAGISETSLAICRAALLAVLEEK